MKYSKIFTLHSLLTEFIVRNKNNYNFTIIKVDSYVDSGFVDDGKMVWVLEYKAARELS